MHICLILWLSLFLLNFNTSHEPVEYLVFRQTWAQKGMLLIMRYRRNIWISKKSISSTSTNSST